MESEVRVSATFRVDSLPCAVQPRNDTVVGAHFERVGQGPKMDPRRLSQLVERTAVGEGGEGFYIARSGRRADLLVSPGGRLGAGRLSGRGVW
jgi:hypothetical protein